MTNSADECLYCLYYQEDEETGEPVCDMDMGLDEDDIARLSYGRTSPQTCASVFSAKS